MLDGTLANISVRPLRSIRKIVPRSIADKQRPIGVQTPARTPRRDPTPSPRSGHRRRRDRRGLRSGSRRRAWPSGPSAIEVGLTSPCTNGSRAPFAVTRKIDTVASCPRDAAVGHVEIAVGAEHRVVDLMKAGGQQASPTRAYSVAPGSHATFTGVSPPSRPDGTTTAMRSGAANAMRAGTPPIVTRSQVDSGWGNPSPRSHSRPPSMTRTGSRLVSTGTKRRCVASQLASSSQFEVPVEVVAPALGRAAQSDRDADRRRRHRPPRRAHQAHARLFGRASALAAVARHAARDDVLPVLAAALRHRHDVIERELLCGEDVSAVLACVFVSRVDVGARERARNRSAS